MLGLTISLILVNSSSRWCIFSFTNLQLTWV